MSQNGIGETGEFTRCHPSLNFFYFIWIVCLTMFTTHPLFLLLSFLGACIYAILLRGKRAAHFLFGAVLPLVILMALFNLFFTHNGATVLFYLNDQRITLEAGLYGLASGVMFGSVLLWFYSFQVIVTTDKFLYLFGRIVPSLALTISMAMRYIPLLKQRFAEVAAGQRCMGRNPSMKNPIKKIRQAAKEISIVIAWSLEASIETGDSMEARGYGLKGRTSFHLYHFTVRDLKLFVLLGCTGILAAAGCLMGGMRMYYYPVVQYHPLSGMQVAVAAAYAVFLAVPMLLDAYSQRKWEQDRNSVYEKDDRVKEC